MNKQGIDYVLVHANQPTEAVLKEITAQVPPTEWASLLREQWERSKLELVALREAWENDPERLFEKVMQPIVNIICNTSGSDKGFEIELKTFMMCSLKAHMAKDDAESMKYIEKCGDIVERLADRLQAVLEGQRRSSSEFDA